LYLKFVSYKHRHIYILIYYSKFFTTPRATGKRQIIVSRISKKKPRHPNSKSKQNKCYFTNVSKLFYNDNINIKSHIGFFFQNESVLHFISIDLIAHCMRTAYYNTLYTALVRVPVQRHHMCIIYIIYYVVRKVKTCPVVVKRKTRRTLSDFDREIRHTLCRYIIIIRDVQQLWTLNSERSFFVRESAAELSV